VSRDSSLGTKTELQRLLTQERITGSLEEVASVHEINRQSTIKEILVHVSLMSKFGLFPTPLTVRGAQNQYFWSTDGDNAAHCAPGQMFCGGQTIQKRITTNNDLEMIVECLFSKTDGIPKRFNVADSSAEGNTKGDRLRRVFGAACVEAARVGKFARIDPSMGLFLRSIEQIFSNYQVQGAQQIEQAILAQQRAIDDGTPLQGVTRQEIIRILEVYRDVLRSADPSLGTVQRLFPHDLWHDYSQLH